MTNEELVNGDPSDPGFNMDEWNDPDLAHMQPWMREHVLRYRRQVQAELAVEEAERQKRREQSEMERRGGKPKRNYVSHNIGPGFRNGKLTITGRDWQSGVNGKYHNGYWLAVCDCGATVRVHNSAIRQNLVCARGCETCAKTMTIGKGHPPDDIKGKRYGRLLPLHYERNVGWTCLCLDCGGELVCRNKFEVMRQGNYQCDKRCEPAPATSAVETPTPLLSVSIAGKVFGRLAVSEYFPALGWLCLCLTCGGNELCESEEEVRRRGNVECDGACVNA